MQLKIIFLSPFNLTAEIENDSPYYSPYRYNVYLDSDLKIENGEKNIFSVSGLFPNREYRLFVKAENDEAEIKFQTPSLKYILSVKEFNAKGDGSTDDT
ncbi:MAG TPA: hypothetical protein VIK96_00525, partial [Bacilli bacterium]